MRDFLDCRFADSHHGDCSGPSNGRECWGHRDCTRGLAVCGHQSSAADLRGRELLPDDLRASIPALYATEEVPTPEKTVHAHLFCAVFDWYVVEIDDEGRIAFGYVYNRSSPLDSEWGYFDLDELEALLVVQARGVAPVYVERDVDFEPKRVIEVTGSLSYM